MAGIRRTAESGMRTRERGPPGCNFGSLSSARYRRTVTSERPVMRANSAGDKKSWAGSDTAGGCECTDASSDRGRRVDPLGGRRDPRACLVVVPE